MREVYEYTRFWAIGSGRDYALGAMYAAWNTLDTAAAVAQLGWRPVASLTSTPPPR